MADYCTSDDSTEENVSKQIGFNNKSTKNSSNQHITNGQKSSKLLKDKTYSELRTFTVPELLCGCQQKCTERVTPLLIQKVCVYFQGMADRERQYDYLAKLIQIKFKQINCDDKTPKEKSSQKKGYRYYVPIVTMEDMRKQIEERNVIEEWEKSRNETDAVNQKFDIEKGNSLQPKYSDFPDWDHIEVCLRAFTTIHLISEKRVTIAKKRRKVQTEIRCTKPFSGYVAANLNGHSLAPVKKVKLDVSGEYQENKSKQKKKSPSDVSLLAAEWLAKEAIRSQPSFPINPKTMLPEGMVLPASITCLPMFPKGNASQIAEDHNRNLDIVDSFFYDQLWKPEYIGDSS